MYLALLLITIVQTSPLPLPMDKKDQGIDLFKNVGKVLGEKAEELLLGNNALGMAILGNGVAESPKEAAPPITPDANAPKEAAAPTSEAPKEEAPPAEAPKEGGPVPKEAPKAETLSSKVEASPPPDSSESNNPLGDIGEMIGKLNTFDCINIDRRYCWLFGWKA